MEPLVEVRVHQGKDERTYYGRVIHETNEARLFRLYDYYTRQLDPRPVWLPKWKTTVLPISIELIVEGTL